MQASVASPVNQSRAPKPSSLLHAFSAPSCITADEFVRSVASQTDFIGPFVNDAGRDSDGTSLPLQAGPVSSSSTADLETLRGVLQRSTNFREPETAQHKDAIVRLAWTKMLLHRSGCPNTVDAKCISALRDQLNDPDRRVQTLALAAYAILTDAHPVVSECVPYIQENINSPHLSTRHFAALAAAAVQGHACVAEVLKARFCVEPSPYVLATLIFVSHHDAIRPLGEIRLQTETNPHLLALLCEGLDLSLEHITDPFLQARVRALIGNGAVDRLFSEEPEDVDFRCFKSIEVELDAFDLI